MFHSRSGTHFDLMPFARLLADHGYPACAADYAGASTWGNDASIAEVGPAKAALEKEGVATDGVFAVANSMGALTCLTYWLANPSHFKAVALLSPVLDLKRLHDDNVAGWAGEVEAAHGGRAAYEAALSTHSPAEYAEALRGRPIKIWYSTADPYVPASTITEFAAASGAELRSLGELDHGTAVWTTPMWEVAEFLERFSGSGPDRGRQAAPRLNART